jgi:hypothetical protein
LVNLKIFCVYLFCSKCVTQTSLFVLSEIFTSHANHNLFMASIHSLLSVFRLIADEWTLAWRRMRKQWMLQQLRAAVHSCRRLSLFLCQSLFFPEQKCIYIGVSCAFQWCRGIYKCKANFAAALWLRQQSSSGGCVPKVAVLRVFSKEQGKCSDNVHYIYNGLITPRLSMLNAKCHSSFRTCSAWEQWNCNFDTCRFHVKKYVVLKLLHCDISFYAQAACHALISWLKIFKLSAYKLNTKSKETKESA